jgi:hypothetical protein
MHAGGKSYTINTYRFLHCPDQTVSVTQSNSVFQVCAATFTKHSECWQSNLLPVCSLLSLSLSLSLSHLSLQTKNTSWQKWDSCEESNLVKATKTENLP